jgi:hypothetical protein
MTQYTQLPACDGLHVKITGLFHTRVSAGLAQILGATSRIGQRQPDELSESQAHFRATAALGCQLFLIMSAT